MTKRCSLLVVVLVMTFAVMVQSVIAQTEIPECKVPPCVYVDRTKADGNEDGTKVHPYNTEDEGRALAQSQPRGGYMYVKDPNSNVWREVYVPRATPGPYGTPLPVVMRFVVLAIITVALILAGWWLIRRSRQIQA